MITGIVGNKITVGLSVGKWYTGQSLKFSASLYNTKTRVDSVLQELFYEISAGEYAIDLLLAEGTYFIYIGNIEVIEGELSQIITINPNSDAKLIAINSVVDSTSADVKNLSSSVLALPLLSDIEASTILAKQANVSIVESIVSNHPTLVDFRNEMINVTFGSLEIANNQLTIKDKKEVTIAIFDLYDKNGNPTMNAVYKRNVVL